MGEFVPTPENVEGWLIKAALYFAKYTIEERRWAEVGNRELANSADRCREECLGLLKQAAAAFADLDPNKASTQTSLENSPDALNGVLGGQVAGDAEKGSTGVFSGPQILPALVEALKDERATTERGSLWFECTFPHDASIDGELNLVAISEIIAEKLNRREG